MTRAVRFGVVTLLATAASLIGAPPIGAGQSDPPSGGELIQNTVFEHEVVEDTTTEVVLTGVDPGFVPVVPDTDDPSAIEQEVAAQLPAGSEFTVTVAKELTDTTFDQTTDVNVTQTPDAIIIGDVNDPGSIIVVAGTVTVTTTETTIETQHFLRTVTIDIAGLGPVTSDHETPPATPVQQPTNQLPLAG